MQPHLQAELGGTHSCRLHQYRYLLSSIWRHELTPQLIRHLDWFNILCFWLVLEPGHNHHTVLRKESIYLAR